MGQIRTVLIVEHDRETRQRMGRWFERAGFRILDCPGPTRQALTCVGSEGGPCPLVDASDLVVLDLWLQSDSLMEGTSSLELLMYGPGDAFARRPGFGVERPMTTRALRPC